MSNPEFKCAYVHKVFLHLLASKNNIGLQIETPVKCNGITLLKEDVQRLITELQSWVDTGEFVKPKRKFVGISLRSKSSTCPFSSIQEVKDNLLTLKMQLSDWQIYELKSEDAIKP